MNSRFNRPPSRGPVAPIHRGPQAHAAPSNTPAYGYYAPNAALLIDFDNVTMGIQKDMQAELRNLLSSDIIRGKVSVQRAYADWRRYPGYIVPLTENSIDLIWAPAYGSAKKNATDIRLAVDAIELVFTRPEIGTFILLSGDSDFSSLVIKLKEYGKYVIGVGIRESASDLLVQNCDEYYSYNALAGLVKSGDEDVRRWDPWELVVEAVRRMVQQGDVMRADRLKQVMQEIDGDFDEKDLGMAKFSRFVQEAASKGLLTVTRLENGQIEIGAVAAVIAPQAAAPIAEEREERPDRDRFPRGRGRSRSRGRDRFPRERDEAGTAVGAPGEGDNGDEMAAAQVEFGAAPIDVVPDRIELADVVDVPRERGRDRGRGRGGRDRAPRPAPAVPSQPIGIAGERLTRDEAYSLVRRAVESLVSGDEAISAGVVRERAFVLHGRDSESLSERNFDRILRDAHDSDVIDLRRRGDSYEVAVAGPVASVSEQLEQAETANTPAPAPSGPPAPRGMGPRGGGGRVGRGARTPNRPGAPPPGLFSVGVVDETGGAATPDVAPDVALDVAPDIAPEPSAGVNETAAIMAAPGRAAQAAAVEAPAARTAPDAPTAPDAGTSPSAASGSGAGDGAGTTGAPRRGRNLRGRARGGRDGGIDVNLLAGVVDVDAPTSAPDVTPEPTRASTATLTPAAAPEAAAPAAPIEAAAPATTDAAPASVAPAADDTTTTADAPAPSRSRGGNRGSGRGAAKSAGKTAAKSATKSAAKSAGKTATKSAAKSAGKTAAKSARRTRGADE